MGGPGDEGKRKLLLAICCAACLLLFFGALATVLSSQKSEDTGDDGTESEAYYPTVPDGKIRQPTPSSADGEAASGDATTKATRKPLPRRPLVCSYKLDMKPQYPYPPDGLCDFLFHTFGLLEEGFNYNDYYNIYDDDRAVLERFKEEGAKSKITLFGIDMYDHYDNMTRRAIPTKEGKDALRGLWDFKIVHYAILDYVIYSAGEGTVRSIVEIAQVLLELRDEYKSLHETENSFFFLGVGPLPDSFEGGLDRSEIVYTYLMSHLVPDAVLYRTTRTDYDDSTECNIVAPSMWSRDNTSAGLQMSFEATLMLRRLSTLWPSSLVQLMSFSPALACTTVYGEAPYGSTCANYELKPASFKCDPANLARNAVLQTSPDKMDVYRTAPMSDGLGTYVFVAYDTPETMKRKLILEFDVRFRKSFDQATVEMTNILAAFSAMKEKESPTFVDVDIVPEEMCKCATKHSFTGGWAMLHMEFSIVDGKGCGDLSYTGNYQELQALRDFMKLNFTAKDCP
ncbi:uncharacterized protein LOC135387716 [Ornithodoros turicata]|uniref:uncharacterized protein LOC135387716 n=1 Tax=Ornithodoros turicata TaxID=34597 RepID=UPI0031395A4D